MQVGISKMYFDNEKENSLKLHSKGKQTPFSFMGSFEKNLSILFFQWLDSTKETYTTFWTIFNERSYQKKICNYIAFLKIWVSPSVIFSSVLDLHFSNSGGNFLEMLKGNEQFASEPGILSLKSEEVEEKAEYKLSVETKI